MKEYKRQRSKLGEGAASEVFQVDDKTAMLVGKREDSYEIYKEIETDMDVLDLLGVKIKCVKIPGAFKAIEPSREYPFGAASFQFVKGQDLSQKYATCTDAQKTAIGKKLAEFVKEVMSVDFTNDKNAVIKKAIESYNKSVKCFEKYLEKSEIDSLRQIRERYKKFMKKSPFVLTHGDLQERNLILDDNNKLVGVIDFGNMEYYVPEIEFAPMMEYDKIIFDSMIKNFGGAVNIDNVKLVGFARHVRYFKHVQDSDEKIKCEIGKIRRFMAELDN